jgi:hypothetical protein
MLAATLAVTLGLDRWRAVTLLTLLERSATDAL